MNFAPLVTLLQAIPGMAARVSVAATVQLAINDAIPQDKYLWLAAPSGQSDANQLLGGAVSQDHVIRFTVLSLTRSVQDQTGRAALAMMDELRPLMIEALLGVRPAADYDPISHVRDAAVWSGEGRLYWADEFRTYHQLRSA